MTYALSLRIFLLAITVSCLSACNTLAIAGNTKNKSLVAINQSALDPVFKEISGLASTDQKYWAINDSGGRAALYSFDKKERALKNVVSIDTASNIDWEDLAQDSKFIYISDSGDNIALRQSIAIYKIAKTELLKSAVNHSIKSKKLTISYADKNNFLPQKNHNFDSEALTVVNNELWLFSKNRQDQRTKLYKIDKKHKTQIIEPTASYPVDGLITAVDYNHKSQQLIFLGYSKRSIFGHSFVLVVDVEKNLPVWSSAARYQLKPYAQWEAIQWVSDKKFIAAAEKSSLTNQTTAEFKLP